MAINEHIPLDQVIVGEHEQWVEGPPHELFTRLRSECPVHWSSHIPEYPTEAGFWSLTTWDDIKAVSMDWQTYSSERGGIRPFEAPEAAAVREVREELGCALTGLAFVSVHETQKEGKKDTVHLYRARAAGEVGIDGFEITEARYFALDALPASVSPATLRRIAEFRGERDPDGSW